jgi:drug/metabolite transporter superfamily protein YnfA
VDASDRLLLTTAMRRTNSTPYLPSAVAALFAYAVVQTLQPEDRYGRLFAACAGVFLVERFFGALTAGSRTASTGSAARSF